MANETEELEEQSGDDKETATQPEPTSGIDPDIDYPDKPEGPIAAAIIAGGIGATALGVVTTLSAANTDFADAMQWSDDVGPLSGKTTVAVIVWLVAWVVCHRVLRQRTYETRRALTVSLVLIAIGVLGTFPTFFQAFD